VDRPPQLSGGLAPGLGTHPDHKGRPEGTYRAGLPWAVSYKEIKDRKVLPIVKEWLSPAQVDLVEKEAPERIGLPTGRRAPLRYQEGKEPVLSAWIQDLYDLKKAPVIAGGQVKPIFEILAPNRRPVQVTSDLEGFWREHYPKLKPQLSRRYPKHEWR
jgi:ATP-dependent helicase HrpB